VERLLGEQEPEIIGLSIMTFQRKTAKGIIDLVRMRRPRARKGKHDDQVDSTAQFLDWFKKPFPNQGYYEWLRQKAEALKQQRRGPRPDQKPKVRSGLPAGGKRIRTAGPTSESTQPRHLPHVADRQHPSCLLIHLAKFRGWVTVSDA
jgi:hypothetical protein